MDIGTETPYGDIYLTGRMSRQFVDAHFGPCGAGITELSIPLAPPSDWKIFVMRIIRDEVAETASIKWITFGSTTTPNHPEFSGMDIEVSALGDVYVTGSITGQVTFEQTYPVPLFTPVVTCETSSSVYRHFVARFSHDGQPMWVAETDADLNTYGQGITLDETSGRLFTGGFVESNGLEWPIHFPHAKLWTGSGCDPGCSFTVDFDGINPTVGFLSQYTLGGQNLSANQMGEKVMDVVMDPDLNHVWITGSVINADRDIMLAKVTVPGGGCMPMTPTYKYIYGDGEDIGLDLAYMGDDKVIVVGNFTQDLVLDGVGPIASLSPNWSDHAVICFDRNLDVFESGLPTTSISGSDPSLMDPTLPYYTSVYDRSICVARKSASSVDFIIAYDLRFNTEISSVEMNTLSVSTGTPISAHDVVDDVGSTYTHTRAMEIEYGTNTTGIYNRYVTGDFRGTWLEFGPCMMPPAMAGRAVGFVYRMDNSHVAYKEQTLGEEGIVAEDAKSQVYPNPFSTSVNLEIRAKANDPVIQAEIFGVDGKLIHSWDASHFQTGSNRIEWNSTGHPAGQYVLKVTRSSGQETLKLNRVE
ncbi:T9SS type A sorting domain-containing protein [bacterium SCSIO 12741]|nr:T9SS type A sorting domain-containing protein [bacterium SCSIO 12741]